MSDIRVPRTLLFGASGAGKSTLAAKLVREAAERGVDVPVLCADPGSPLFGVPGTVGLGRWRDGGFQLTGMEALCTLDAARFRLPLVMAVERLAAGLGPGPVLVDAPGVTQGMAAAELLPALVRAARVEAVLVVVPEGEETPLAEELSGLGIEVEVVSAAPGATRPAWLARARARTAMWDAHLGAAREVCVAREGLAVLGAPPPGASHASWVGRQAALLDGAGRTLGIGEITAAARDELTIRIPLAEDAKPTGLLVRDAHRGAGGLLTTAPRPAGERTSAAGSDMRPDARGDEGVAAPAPVHVAGATCVLVNGVFGDPLFHLRFRQARRSIFFDLGDAGRLQARITHQVSDVFVTHAHFDHFGGFLWLLRSRIGLGGVCRLTGPRGLAGHAASLMSGIHWDRIGDEGPRFEVREVHGDVLRHFALQAGRPGPTSAGEEPIEGGVVLREPGFVVRATTLDHGIEVLAWALDAEPQVNVVDERLAASGLAPGPWLEELKRAVRTREPEAPVHAPAGTVAARELADLVVVRPGETLAYATDFADTPPNRERLVALARGAHTLLCEATFLRRDAVLAHRTSHLTARACGEIAAAAGVGQLVPFHFSRRYERCPELVYREARAACPQTLVPRWARERSRDLHG